MRPVRGVSFDVNAGEIVGIVGESGSGKTLTSLALTGLTPRTATVGGSVRLDGRQILGLNKRALRELRGRRFGYVFQDPQAALNPLMTCGDQVAETLHTHLGMPMQKAKERAIELFRQVGLRHPERCITQYPHELSGGMRQRVMIAIAICCDPSVIVADEPTTALDVIVTTQVIALLRSVRDRTGAGMLFISHDLRLVGSMADRIVVMYGGQIVENGRTEQILQDPAHTYTRALVKAAPDLYAPKVRRFVGIDEDLLQAAVAGTPDPTILLEADAVVSAGGTEPNGAREEVRQSTESTEAPRDDAVPVLSAQGLTVRFAVRGPGRQSRQTVDAVSDVSLLVRRGEVLGIVGESGSGKTSLARSLVGMVPVSAGTIVYRGATLFPSGSRHHRVPRSIQMVFQDPYASLNPRMRVTDLVAEAFDIAGMGKRDPARVDAVVELLERVGIEPELRDRYPHQFSGGQRQRIAIARALAAEPDLLICDEAVSSLDVSIRAHVLNVLASERDRSGLAIIFIGHDLSVIRHIADAVVVMRNGELIEAGTTEDVIFSPQANYTRDLIRASRYELDQRQAS